MLLLLLLFGRFVCVVGLPPLDVVVLLVIVDVVVVVVVVVVAAAAAVVVVVFVVVVVAVQIFFTFRSIFHRFSYRTPYYCIDFSQISSVFGMLLMLQTRSRRIIPRTVTYSGRSF